MAETCTNYATRTRHQSFQLRDRIGEDAGKTWSAPIRLADMPVWDGGYPSSVERADGRIVTASYADHPKRGENQYQMDVVIWEIV
ncbi:MAG: hypothetical protein ABI210_11100 [Abditibacteriaceae bacterium]